MSPRARTSKPIQPGPDQGAFFGVESTANGATDPSDFAMTAKVVVPSDGEAYFPPDPSSHGGAGVISVEGVHDELEKTAEAKRKRRRGGTTIVAAGAPEMRPSYAERIKPGFFLYKFGPVTYSNWEDAKCFAGKLDAERLAMERANPTFDSDVHNATPVVEALVQAFNIERALSPSGEPERVTEPEEATRESVPAQITPDEKLAIIREKAGFVPATHDEKNTAIGLIFSSTERGRWWVYSYLLETQDHLVKHYKSGGATLPAAREQARAGVVSRINEMGDYLQQSRDDGKALLWLQQKLDATTNPSLTLEEVVTDTFDPVEPGEDLRTKDGQLVLWAMAAIVRYIDAETHQELNFLPMTEREDRSSNSDQEGKNKQLYNPYVAAFMLTDERPGIVKKYEVIRTHVMDRVRAITAAELRTLVPRALDDQRKRYRFWNQALLDVRGSYESVAKQRLDS